STTSGWGKTLPLAFQNRYQCGKIRDSVAEKVSQTPEAPVPAEGGERTVVDARMDSEHETVTAGPRRGNRGATAPIPAPMEGGDTRPESSNPTGPPDPRFLELASGDLIEERTDQSAAVAEPPPRRIPPPALEDDEPEEPATIPAEHEQS